MLLLKKRQQGIVVKNVGSVKLFKAEVCLQLQIVQGKKPQANQPVCMESADVAEYSQL